MTTGESRLYDFVFRGFLAEEALDREGRLNKRLLDMADEDIAKSLPIDLLDDIHVASGRAMSVVYAAIAAFENGVRSLVVKVLIERFKEEWWEKGVSSAIRERAQKRKKTSRPPDGMRSGA